MMIFRCAFVRLRTRGSTEFGLLAAMFTVAGMLFGFIKLASEVNEGDTHAFDTAIILAFRNSADLADPIGPWWMEALFKDFTSLGSTAVLTFITLAVVGYFLIEGKRRDTLLVIVAVGGGTILSTLLKVGFERPRPDLVSHAADVYTASFPSGHSMLSAVTYLTLGALLARVQVPRIKAYIMFVALSVVLLIGVSRVYLGVHWPTDVLAGWCLGAAWAMSCWLAALWLARKDTSAPASRE